MHKWCVPWTKLVLFEVYVRSHMTFAAATWVPAYLEMGQWAARDTPLGILAAQ